MLFIRYSLVQSLYEQDPLVTWVWQDQGVFHVAQQPVVLSQLIAQLPPSFASALLHPVAVILPSEAVSLHSLELPQVKKQQLMKVVPYALEEKLAEDIERLHFSVGAIDRNKPLKIAVISRFLLQHCLAQLNHYHFYPVSIVSEAALLLGDNSVQQIFVEGEKAFICMASDSVITLAREQIATVLPKLFSVSEGDFLLANMQELSLDMLCEEYAVQVREKRVLNILQGNFKQKTEKTISARRSSWRSVAILVAVAILIKLGLYTGEIFYYGHQSEVAQAQSVELYKRYFPQAKRIHDVKRELKAKLRQLNNGENHQVNFLVLLSKVQQPLTELTKNKVLSVDIQSLSYDQAQGQLRMDISLPDFPALDNLKKSLDQSGLIMVIDAANQNQGHVKARIKLGAV